jgi:hypothetical protein
MSAARMAKLIFLRVSGGHGSEAAYGLAMPAANVPRHDTGSPELADAWMNYAS